MKKTINRIVNLKPWEELIGAYKRIKHDKFRVSLFIGNFRIDFAEDSKEAEILKKELSNVPVGQRIGLLRTDNPTKPILITKSLGNHAPESERLCPH